MHSRRYILQVLSIGAMSGVSGCAGAKQKQADSVESVHSIRDSVIYGCLKMMVSDVLVRPKIVEKTALNTTRVSTPDSGSVFVLVKITLENTCEHQIPYPKQVSHIGLRSPAGPTVPVFPIEFTADGQSYPTYENQVEHEGVNGRIPPNTQIEGWRVFEAPDGFRDTKNTVTIKYGTSEKRLRTFYWELPKL